MPEKKDPNKINKITGQLEDEEILELADEVLKAPDDEIVELTNIADTPLSDDEEEIIDLSEVADIPLEEDEEIMDLTDGLDETPGMDAGVTELSDIAAESAAQEEEVIDLDDFVDEVPAGDEEVLDIEDMVEESPREISEGDTATERANEAEVLELTESDREAIAEELSLDLDVEPLEDTVELTDELGQPEAQQSPEDTAELPDRDIAADTTDARSDETEEGESDTVELTELDSETLDKELGELSLDLEDTRQAETVDLAPDQQSLSPDSFMDDDIDLVDDTVEMKDVGQTPVETQETFEQKEPASQENLEFTAADRDIIDEEISLDTDKESREQELSFDAETLAQDTQVTGVERQLDSQNDTQPGTPEPPATDEKLAAAQDDVREEELGFDFDKGENLADSLGMTLDSEMDSPEDFADAEEPEDIYKTQEILNEISQFDTMEKSSLHKQTDPISIRVQDPAVENRLEIDSLEQDATAVTGSLSPEQLESAIERVVKKMFSEKIESILVQVIERTVSKEINRIKNILLDETSGDV